MAEERLALNRGLIIYYTNIYSIVLIRFNIMEDDPTERQSSEQQHNENDKYAMSWVLGTSTKIGRVMSILAQSNQPTWSNILKINSLCLIHLTSHVNDVSAKNGSRLAINGRSICQAKYLDYSIHS